MPVRLNSTGGGSVTLDVPSTAGTFTVNLPAANGDVVVTGGGSTVQFGAGSVSAPSITFSGDTNTGIYSPAADTIAFSEGGVEAMRIDASGNLAFNSGYGSAVTAFGCRAWVNFNGTGTVAIRASGNVSSITDNGTGDFTVNFTTAMSDANYSISVVHSAGSGGTVGTNININGSGGSVAPTTSAFRMVTVGGGSVVDPLYVNASVIR